MFSDRTKKLTDSETLALNAKVKELQASGKTVYNLTAGEPDAMTPDYVRRAVAANLEQNKYTPTSGLAELRQKIATSANNFYRVKWISPENVIVTAGTKTALLVIFQVLLNDGDEVIVPSPFWSSYKHIIQVSGGKVVEVPLSEKYDIDAVAIGKKINSRTKAILLNSPQNPTGTVFSKKQLAKLAKHIEDKNIFVIADDIYARLVYESDFEPITSFFKDPSHLIIANGFSKSQALTGWRIGYLIAPPEVAKVAGNFVSHALGNAPLPGQLAAIAALDLGDRPPMLTDLMRRRQLVIEALNKIPKIKYVPPAGAFYFFIDIGPITNDSQKWCDELLERMGVALVPGEAFGAPGFVRLSFAAADKTLVAALQKIKDFIS